jgi:phospholipid/cholesterol/gamma-HCH transport system permease protein
MVATLGRGVVSVFAFVGDEAILFTNALSFLLRGRIGARRTIDQMSIAGTDSLPIVIITLLLVGMAWSWHTATYLVRFGASSYFGGGTAIAVARELGPALCGVVVAARIGAAYAAEIGTMTVTEQVDALRALAINPNYYLVAPRLVATALMLPVLTVVADAAGIFGAYLISANFGISTVSYLASIHQWLTPHDVYGGIIKAFVFGIIIALVGCRQGLRTRGGAAGVGRATISSVVLSIVLIYAANMVMTVLIYAY